MTTKTAHAAAHRLDDSDHDVVDCPNCSTRITLIRDATLGAAVALGRAYAAAEVDEAGDPAGAAEILAAHPCSTCTVDSVLAAIRFGREFGRYLPIDREALADARR